MRTTCRDEILDAVKELIRSKGINEFHMAEVVNYMKENRTEYTESTIKTHIVSKCCKNAPHNHAKHYDDFERMGEGVYRILG
jgi:hypothetical protein